MKRKLTLLLMLLIASVSSYATKYYSKTSGAQIRLVTTWSSTTDGTGASPANLTTSGDEFIIQGGHAMITGNITTFDATNSTLRILAGGSLTATHLITVGNFIVEDGGRYTHSVAQLFPASSGIIAVGPTSTVEVTSHTTGVLPAIVWGNLIINVSLGSEWVINDQPTFETKGDLIIRKTGSVISRVVRLSPNSGVFNLMATIGGDFVVEGGTFALSASNDAASKDNHYKLWVKGDLIVEDKGTANYAGNTVAELRMSSANSYTATFSVEVDGNTHIKKGSFISSNVATNASPNINMDLNGNFTVDADGVVILSKAATVSGTIKAISMVVGGNVEVNGTFTGTAGANWSDALGGATVYFKGGAANSTFKMAMGQGSSNIAYVVGKNKTLTLQSSMVTDKFLAVAGHVIENGNTITGNINTIVNAAIAFNGDVAASGQSVIILQDGATVSGLGLMAGMEVTSLANNLLSTNTVVTQIVDQSTIAISRAAINADVAYSGAAITPKNFNIVANAGTLPLTLVDFRASRELNGVKLQWKTAQEKNVAQIVVERSINAAAFNVITAMNAYNTESQQTYSYLDRTAPSFGYVYYRLKIIDNDGSVAYSAITVVNSIALTSNDGLKIYPNPVTDYLNVSYPVAIGSGNLKVLSTDGKLIIRKTIEKGQNVNKINVSSLKQGIYIVVYQTISGQVYTSKFVK